MLAQPITRSEAARELLTRRRARESLLAYAQAIEIPGAPVSEDPDEWLFHPIETGLAAHHALFLTELQACIEKPYGRLIITSCPGSAKSTYVGPVATTWAMGKWPGFKVVSTSHSTPPALRTARRAQQIIRSPQYRGIFAAGMLKGNEGVEEFTISNGSSMLSAGIVAGITSSRADLGIIDDPVATREDADSETIRRKVRMEYEDSFLTRLKPKASIVIIMTRWQEDDLVGSILPADYKGESGDILCRDGQVWRVVNLPAEAEHKDDPLGRKPGQMLWPEWFDAKHWAIYRNNARTWSALYQQRPAPDTGGQFERKDFKRYTVTPSNVRWYMAADYAVTELTISDRPDFTQAVVCGVRTLDDDDVELYLEKGWGGQEGPDKAAAETVNLVKEFKPVELLIERGVILNAMQSLLLRVMRQRKAFTVIEPMASNKDKIAKAAAFRARVKMGMVYVKDGPWGDGLIAECCSFPFGRFDDAVDACGMLGRRIDDMFAPKDKPSVARKKPVVFGSEAMLMAADEDDAAREAARRRFRR